MWLAKDTPQASYSQRETVISLSNFLHIQGCLVQDLLMFRLYVFPPCPSPTHRHKHACLSDLGMHVYKSLYVVNGGKKNCNTWESLKAGD